MYDAKSRVNTKKQKQNTILNTQNKAMIFFLKIVFWGFRGCQITLLSSDKFEFLTRRLFMNPILINVLFTRRFLIYFISSTGVMTVFYVS